MSDRNAPQLPGDPEAGVRMNAGPDQRQGTPAETPRAPTVLSPKQPIPLTPSESKRLLNRHSPSLFERLYAAVSGRAPLGRAALVERISQPAQRVAPKPAVPGLPFKPGSRRAQRGSLLRKFWVHLRSDCRTLVRWCTPGARPSRPRFRQPARRWVALTANRATAGASAPAAPAQASLIKRLTGGKSAATPAKTPGTWKDAGGKRWKPAASSRSLKRVRRRFALGLDVGSHAIKWVQFGEVNNSVELIELGTRLYTPSSAAQNPHLAAAASLQELCRVHKWKGPVNLSLRLESASLKTVKLPPLPESELNQALRWQVEKDLPNHTRFEDVCVDYVPVSAFSPSQERHFLVVSTPRAHIDPLLQCIKGTPLQIARIDIDPLAIETCLLRLFPERAQETALLLHIGTQRASMSILAKGSLVFSRSSLITGGSLTQAITEKLHLPRDGAEQFKQEYGILDLVEPQLGDESDPRKAAALALASPMENLMVDLMHAFMAFSHQGTQSHIKQFDRVYVCGGGSQLPGLIEWLRKRLEVPVEPIHPFQGRHVPEAAELHGPLESIYPQMTIATGLALRELVEKA